MKGTERDEDALRSALRALADDDAMLNTSSSVEQRLLAELNARARVRRVRSRVLQMAAAAVLIIAVGLPLWYASRKAVGPVAQPSVPAAATREEVTEFFPLAYSDVPAPGGYVVRMQVPRTALTSFGVIGFGGADDRSPTVAADVLVGGDGLARAVRFVHMVRETQRQEQP